jgi:hypothetical protein
MAEILVRSGKPPHVAVSPEAALARHGWGVFGANVGNVLFLTSVFRALNTKSTHAVADSLYPERTRPPQYESMARQISERFTAWALPLANAFRPSWLKSLDNLTEVITRCSIPVTVVGVGLQAAVDDEASDSNVEFDSNVEESARRFVKAVLERSASIGVRGERTAGFLRRIGFPDDVIDIIGCPSLFDGDGSLHVTRTAHFAPDSPMALNLLPSRTLWTSSFDALADRFPNMTYVAQVHFELEMLLWGLSEPSRFPGIPFQHRYRLYQNDRIRFFLDARTWREFMAQQRFSFGPRFHGNVAAITAGTPALILTHDSRTLELAEYHSIPYLQIGPDPLPDPEELFDLADYDEFNQRHLETFERYLAFLNRNGLDHIHRPGSENPEYTALLESTEYPGAVRVTEANLDWTGRELLRKLAWLRQGSQIDMKRWVGGYIPEFKPTLPE